MNIITIDGPSGSGKGTLATKLAQHYQFQLLDSGAIYRLLGLSLAEQGLLNTLNGNIAEAVHVATHLDIEFIPSNAGILTYLNGQDVSKQIRQEDVGQFASKVAAVAPLRDALLARQRQFATLQGLVADGRDMGTVVFPQAQAKIYLTASVTSRAERRYKQLQAMGVDAKLSAILINIEERDRRDMEREVAPLKPATDAIIIDSSHLSIDTVFNQMCAYIDTKLI
ncbi:(d)CMP kinase [Acinetobacter rathckeae]|uniref:(d)CMP kinase n=1 Tax=Acinetobacter rathckeae TaxID=2605272 RepID=UPI0018A2CD21|nr:(d)CMP kinase [Acinetobacter rathckeae]MBF7687660.1 (d)CMP kinase [Acinetobacter rathckeae]MBF7695062.1 (d)CMP kinase [Acinetobacter rathckeae]